MLQTEYGTGGCRTLKQKMIRNTSTNPGCIILKREGSLCEFTVAFIIIVGMSKEQVLLKVEPVPMI